MEVGSRNVNGSLRPIIERSSPADYIGVDIENGPGVDMICDADKLVDVFGSNKFDLVVSMEMLEHVKDWQKVISNIKKACNPGGVILITTRSYGFHYHAYPYDFWRYEMNDMKEIFNDCEILALESDGSLPGVFIKAKKPSDFQENNLLNYGLYSMITNKRIPKIEDKDFRCKHYRQTIMRLKTSGFIDQCMISVGKHLS